MRPQIATVVLVAALASPVFAQAPAVAPPPPTQKDVREDLKGLLELEPPPGGYVYKPEGRRDPFVSLLRPVSADLGGKKKLAGPPGFLIQEIALKGIVKSEGRYTAMFLGPDSNSYFLKVGQRFFDGVLKAIDDSSVTFDQEVTDPLTPAGTIRSVKQSLKASEETKQ